MEAFLRAVCIRSPVVGVWAAYYILYRIRVR